jgi:hypothetical protein
VLQVRALQATPSLEAVFAHLEHFHSPDLPADSASRLPCLEGAMPCPTAVAMLIRRAAFDRVGVFDEHGGIGEVVDWYLRARSSGLIESILPETLAGNTSLIRASERSRYAGIVKAALDRRRAAAAGRNDS